MAGFHRPFRAPPLRKRADNILRFTPHGRKQAKVTTESWWKASWPLGILLCAPFIGVGIAWSWHAEPVETFDRSASIVEQYDVRFDRCGTIRTTCVVDGDTFWLKGTKIRIADVNTPEISAPQCAAERALGERATERLIALLNAGGFSLLAIDRDEDSYGRKLRIVTRGGESLGRILVDEGLAEFWTDSRRNWC